MYELAIIAFVVVIGSLYVTFRMLKSGKTKAQLPPETSINAGATKVLPVGMLIAKSGVHRGMVFAIEPSGLRIGRDKAKNQVVIDSDVVSREHAWVGLENGAVVIKDLNSLNGTYINSMDEARISTVTLKDGDIVFIGKTGTDSFKYKAS